MAARENGKVPVAGLVFGAIALVLIAIVLLAGDTSQEASETGAPVVSGSLVPLQQGMTPSNDPAVGTKAPTVSGADFDDNAVEIQPGTPTAVVFLAHWCPFCQAEVPAVQQWIDATGGVEGVDIVAVSTALDQTRGNYPPSKWLEREGWTSPIIVDDAESGAYRAFGGTAFPYWVFLDADGNVVQRRLGGVDTTELQAIMESLKN
ncbi:thiol-disulfide oxidoreductase [bacterium BMS3Bbin02]|nr:thiol-disulfide oxidoreductase [bacterium BMS3Bbin02]